MRRFCIIALLVVGVAGCSGATTSSATASSYTGTFALPGKTQKADATLSVTFAGPTSAHLDIAETAKAGGATITNYDVDMTKQLHMIVISDDFTSFQHIHPALGKDGHFTIDMSVPAQGRYLIYADAVPHGLGQQVFRFDVPFGSNAQATTPQDAASVAPGTDANTVRPPNLTPTAKTATAGPYTVTLSSLKLDAGETSMLIVKIDKGGKPAPDLQPYLGGAAHAVFIGAADDSYTHVHPMAGTDMSSMSTEMGEMKDLPDSAKIDPAMMLHVTAPKAGTYKLWLQFRGGGQLYVAPFVLTAT